MERTGTEGERIEPGGEEEAQKKRGFPNFVDLMKRLRPVASDKAGTLGDIRLQESHFGETRKEPTEEKP